MFLGFEGVCDESVVPVCLGSKGSRLQFVQFARSAIPKPETLNMRIWGSRLLSLRLVEEKPTGASPDEENARVC